VSFVGRVDIAPYFWSQVPQKCSFGTGIGVFSPNVQMFKLPYYQSQSGNSNQILLSDKDLQILFVGRPKCASQIQDGGESPSLKNHSATIWPISTIYTLRLLFAQIFTFCKSR